MKDMIYKDQAIGITNNIILIFEGKIMKEEKIKDLFKQKSFFVMMSKNQSQFITEVLANNTIIYPFQCLKCPNVKEKKLFIIKLIYFLIFFFQRENQKIGYFIFSVNIFNLYF